MLGDDVEDCRARHLLWLIEAHAVEHARSAVMPGGGKAVETERRHYLDLILRHGTERIAGMVVAARRLFGIAVAAQVGRHHGKFFCQPRGDLVPRDMRKRIAVHQQEWRALAAMKREDAGATCLDLGAGEPFEHPS